MYMYRGCKKRERERPVALNWIKIDVDREETAAYPGNGR